MANRNIIVIRKAGMLINPSYVEKAVKDATYMGISFVHDGKLIVDYRKGRPNLQAVMDVQNDDQFKDKTIIFNFGENKTILDEDMQPFHIVVDQASGAEVAVFLDGKFDGYTVKNSSHTDEWHCKEDFISHKLKKIFKMANAGLAGLVTELNDPVTQQDFSNSWTNYGFIAMMPSVGEVVHIANKGNIFKGEYPWGVTSYAQGYTEKAVEEKVEDKPMSILDRLKAKASGKMEATPAPAAAPVIPADGEYEEVRLPEEAHENGVPEQKKKWTNKVKSNWWFNEVGYQPEGYKLMNTVVKRYKGTKRGIMAPLAAGNVTDKPEKPDLRVDPKTLPDTTEKVADTITDTSAKHVSVDNLPIIGPKTKLLLRQQWFTDAEVAKTLGDDMKELAYNPKKLKELTENLATFRAGFGLEEDTVFSYEALLKLAAIHPEALAKLCFDEQTAKIGLQIKLKSILLDPAAKIATPNRAAM